MPGAPVAFLKLNAAFSTSRRARSTREEPAEHVTHQNIEGVQVIGLRTSDRGSSRSGAEAKPIGVPAGMEGFMSSPIGQKQEITTSLMDAFYHTREAPPEFGFGTSVRPPLNDCEEAAPGPGAYTIKTTVLGDVPQSSIRSAPQFSLRSREKFGNPMLKAVDPTTMLEPGPGHYKARVVNPQEDCAPKFSFPKSSHPREKSKLDTISSENDQLRKIISSGESARRSYQTHRGGDVHRTAR